MFVVSPVAFPVEFSAGFATQTLQSSIGRCELAVVVPIQ